MWPRVGKHGWERRAMLGVKVDVMRLRQGMRARARERATNAVFKNGVPEKMTDPKSFTVPCSIGDVDLGCTLCDLGANRSIARPEGKNEDKLIKVDKFIVPANFVILDYKVDQEVPIILEWQTGRTLIDVRQGELTIQLNDQNVTFNIVNALKLPF
ncbi:uncharacterized protein E5676_scaffold352G007180 [Cucumis melo var. makuwa]|uniref:Uncharacterized protein n=1 Tax=Cucumis melo var. makuwa TaxID=1194695 RepID=A0A5D3DPR8_CUCMM|nr:uncharacterized protein E5676_scaffold352G007180 [Cucumis melo var. makuwa]